MTGVWTGDVILEEVIDDVAVDVVVFVLSSRACIFEY
jgi:hypothetical protein